MLTESPFDSFTLEHLIPILITLFVAFICIYTGRNLSDRNQKYRLGILLSLIPLAGVFLRSFMQLSLNAFEIQEDLPCHLCSFMGVIGPFVMWMKNRKWFGIFYFWIFVGTLNAVITPDIIFGFPHFHYYAYWLLHLGLIILAFYIVFVLDVWINWKDFWNAYFSVNAFLIFTLVLNFTISSNYMYSLRKPESGSLLDSLGPWPWYLVSGQLLALGLCFLMLMPFLIANIRRKPSKH